MNAGDYIRERVLLFDGSMGTYFAEKYRDYAGACETANLRDPEKVKAIHREYGCSTPFRGGSSSTTSG